MRPAKEKEEWEITCSCMSMPPWKCRGDTYHPCERTRAYSEYLDRQANYRLGLEIKPGFKPASPAQIAEWATWLASPEAASAAQRNSEVEKQGKRDWKNHKFDPVTMERHIHGMWPHERSRFMTGPMYLAYKAFAEEQRIAKEDYVAKAASIKTMEDYDKAEQAYKKLLDHVKDHGEIYKLPKKTHKKPDEAAPEGPKHVGRRAARKARNESEKSEAGKKQYSRAELRTLVRAHEGREDGATVDSDAESTNDE